jgi:hypothetical protein
MKNIIIAILVAIILILGFLFFTQKKSNVNYEPWPETEPATVKPTTNNTTNNYPVQNNSTTAQTNTTKIKVPLISEGSGDFGPFGCGSYITFVEVEVPKTEAKLKAVYDWLFTRSGIGNYQNTVSSNPNLSFEKVSIANGVAKVYLNGTIMANECGDATFGGQIEQAAFQYSAVSGIEVYVNNQIFSWCSLSQADASESRCDINPRLWNKQIFKEL